MPTQPSIFTDDEWDALAQSLSLSPRQFEVIRHLFDGACDKQIAARMNVSVSAVRAHISKIFLKCQVNDRSELILHVVRIFRDMQGGTIDMS